MSNVTNIIILTGLGEDPQGLTEQFKKFSTEQKTPFNLVWIEDELLPSKWYGGTKKIEANVFIGAFNHLNTVELFHFLKEMVAWKEPKFVQVLIQEQFDLTFRLYSLSEL